MRTLGNAGVGIVCCDEVSNVELVPRGVWCSVLGWLTWELTRRGLVELMLSYLFFSVDRREYKQE
jgi:hypothetical protein